MNELKKLALKIFFKRKAKEIFLAFKRFALTLVCFGLLSAGVLLCFGLGVLLLWYLPQAPTEILALIGIIVFGGTLIVVGIGVIMLFCVWLNSNWKASVKEAKQALKTRKMK